MTEPSLTVGEFCQGENISKGKLYQMWRKKTTERPFGDGPAFFWVGVTKRISPEARQQWRRDREAEARARAIAELSAA